LNKTFALLPLCVGFNESDFNNWFFVVQFSALKQALVTKKPIGGARRHGGWRGRWRGFGGGAFFFAAFFCWADKRKQEKWVYYNDFSKKVPSFRRSSCTSSKPLGKK
jgi:hypothetical protein